MNFHSILIITYGRSGSTLLQGILNSIEGILIRGENYNFCYDLYKAYMNIKASRKHCGKNPQQPWYGCNSLDENLFLNDIQNTVKSLLIGDMTKSNFIKCYGFKEIRYIKQHVPNFDDYLKFLRKIFPKPAFIFNLRNIDAVAKSKWWAYMQYPEVEKILTETEFKFKSYYNNHKDHSYITKYEEIVNKPSSLKNLFDFLGVEYSLKKINEILNHKHSY